MKTLKFKVGQDIEITMPNCWKKSEAKQLAQDIAQGVNLNGNWDTKNLSHTKTVNYILYEGQI